MATNAPAIFKFSMPGQPVAAVALSRFADGLSDFRPFWSDYVVPNWYRHVANQYATQGGSTGDRWAALTAAYAAWKQKHYPGQPIGVLTGATRASLTSPGDPNAILTISKDALAVGTSLPYPIYLQIGTRRMRARPPLRVSEEFLLLAGKLLQEFGVKAARDAGVGAEAA